MSEAGSRVPLRHVFAAFAGNALAFYDFLTFSYFSIDIGRTFFPTHDRALSLLASLATFGIGFVMRPVGAIVIGRWADRAGRKPAMLLTFALLGIGIAGMALTPSYAQIGIAAPIIVVSLRLMQGFALGGEVGPTTAFVAELVPAAKRGFYLAMQFAMQDCATLAAGLIGLGLALYLSDAQLQSWGWRAAMLVGAAIVPFGFYLRRSLPETLNTAKEAEADAGPKTEAPVLERIRPYRRILVLGFVMLAAGTIGSYAIGYMTTYARDTLHLATTVAFGFTIINGAFSVVTEFLSGWLADRYGRKPVMIIPYILLLVSILPCYWVIAHYRNALALYGAETVMVIFAGVAQIPVLVVLTEQVPARIRSGAVAIVYAFAISIFGGSTQAVINRLINWTGDPLAPAYYWGAATLVGLVAMFLVKESAPALQRRIG